MLDQILTIEGVQKIDTKKQKFVLGGSCRSCYMKYGGGVNYTDPDCWGCEPPVPHE